MADLDFSLVTPPGLETPLAEEARAAGFKLAGIRAGGVEARGGWPEIWRANLVLRGASHVLVRLGGFRAFHLAQLDKRARKFPWGDFLRADVPIKVEASCRKSKIYHAGAAQERVARAITETLGAPVADQAGLRLLVRIDDNLVTFSLDSSGTPLHKRGFKPAVGKAPMRETMAAMFLRAAGFSGGESVFDPMCGSGTFPLEAAEIALGLLPGRARRFAFEDLPGFDADHWAEMRCARPVTTPHRFTGSDRNAGAIEMSRANANAAGLAEVTGFTQAPISEATPPEGPPGLVMINPPYGARIGDKGALFALHGRMGEVLRARFAGWRVGLVTSDGALARATGLPFAKPGPYVAHGGLKVRLYQTGPLPNP